MMAEKVFSTRERIEMQTPLPHYLIRNMTDPSQKELGIVHLSGKTQVSNVKNLDTKEDLREYLGKYDPKKRTKVHRDIAATLLETPELFSTLNSGVTLCSTHVSPKDPRSNVIYLQNASIINGAQTQGEVINIGEIDEGAYIQFNLLVIQDPDITALTTIALNNQNPVKAISIANKKGTLKDLDAVFGDQRITLQESDLRLGAVDTEKLVQVLTALTPPELWTRKRDKEGTPCKNWSYGSKQRCLVEYQEVYKAAKNPEHPDHTCQSTLYRCYLDIAQDAWDLYLKWKTHPGFSSSRIKAIKKKNGKVTDVPDAFVFPILSAMSHLVRRHRGRWKLEVHPKMDKVDADMIEGILWYNRYNARSRSHQCGRNQSCYSFMHGRMARWV